MEVEFYAHQYAAQPEGTEDVDDDFDPRAEQARIEREGEEAERREREEVMRNLPNDFDVDVE